MDFGSFLQNHLYAALVLGSFVEGETTVVLAGYAAHQGYAPYAAVAAVAAVANFLLDLGWYLLGHARGEWLQSRWPAVRRGVELMRPRVLRNRHAVVFLVRFMYGLRTVGPIALGIMRVPLRDMLVFGALGATVWAVLFSAIGYAFGRAVTLFLHRLAHEEAWVAAALGLGTLCFVLYRRHRSRQSDARPVSAERG
ncbi:DedA family protein [Verticiella sediminum]|nr:DedA family protein [Verticiella sediminum]